MVSISCSDLADTVLEQIRDTAGVNTRGSCLQSLSACWFTVLRHEQVDVHGCLESGGLADTCLQEYGGNTRTEELLGSMGKVSGRGTSQPCLGDTGTRSGPKGKRKRDGLQLKGEEGG